MSTIGADKPLKFFNAAEEVIELSTFFKNFSVGDEGGNSEEENKAVPIPQKGKRVRKAQSADASDPKKNPSIATTWVVEQEASDNGSGKNESSEEIPFGRRKRRLVVVVPEDLQPKPMLKKILIPSNEAGPAPAKEALVVNEIIPVPDDEVLPLLINRNEHLLPFLRIRDIWQ